MTETPSKPLQPLGASMGERTVVDREASSIWHVSWSRVSLDPFAKPAERERLTWRTRFRYWRAAKWGSFADRLTSLRWRIDDWLDARAMAANARSDKLFGFNDAD